MSLKKKSNEYIVANVLPRHPNSLDSHVETPKYKISQTHLDILQFDHQ